MRSGASPVSAKGSSGSASAGKGAGGRMSPLGRRETRDLLARYGLRPRTSLGQHFLVDPNTIRKIVRLASVEAGELIVEVGAGVGALTVALAEAGASVVAIEQDRSLEPALSETVADL